MGPCRIFLCTSPKEKKRKSFGFRCNGEEKETGCSMEDEGVWFDDVLKHRQEFRLIQELQLYTVFKCTSGWIREVWQPAEERTTEIHKTTHGLELLGQLIASNQTRYCDSSTNIIKSHFYLFLNTPDKQKLLLFFIFKVLCHPPHPIWSAHYPFLHLAANDRAACKVRACHP